MADSTRVGHGSDDAGELPGSVREHVPVLTGAVVVGTDGSPPSRRALRFAAIEARLRGAPLVVLRSWSLTHAPRPPGSEPGVVPPMTAFEQAVVRELEEEVADELGSDPGVDVLPMPVHQVAADALVDSSGTAALVVVGHRGRGGIAALVLGSVSSHVVAHARGPIAVVP